MELLTDGSYGVDATTDMGRTQSKAGRSFFRKSRLHSQEYLKDNEVSSGVTHKRLERSANPNDGAEAICQWTVHMERFAVLT